MALILLLLPQSYRQMKTYKRVIFIICTILGLIGFWMMVAFTNYNSCEYANTNIDFVKTQTQTALEANDINIVKLFTNNALDAIDQTKSTFIDCGCLEATDPINSIEKNLKLVTRATKIEESKDLLKVALQNVVLSIKLLREHEEENTSFYGNDVLEMNTKSSLDRQGGIVLPKGKAREELIYESLTEFKISIDNVVKNVDCEDAFFFISKIHKNAKRDLNNISLSENERFYHEKVRDIAYQALLKLDGCPVD